ncbi:MAG: HEAT repeat domain-containing protein [Symploca sp. SIO1A3]|nr:HEAT repeat domain-containing protein [Symploca sp. SIO1A3]
MSLAALINALKSSKYDVGMSAVEALGKIGSYTAVTALINVLEDSKSNVRMNAAAALGKTCSDTAIPQLIKKLQAHKSATNSTKDNLNQTLKVLQTIQERCQYYRPNINQEIR